MKLKVNYELEIEEEKVFLIDAIALQEGWQPESSLTSKEYINKYVSIPRVKLLFEQIIEKSVRAYFGIMGKSNADAVMDQYKLASVVTSEFVD